MDALKNGADTAILQAVNAQATHAVTGAHAAAATAPPSIPAQGTMGALPAGWHACNDPTHNRTYYFNTVTKQSQWTMPTAAAAVPLAPLPGFHTTSGPSPASRRRAANGLGGDLGGVGDMAASYGLPIVNK